MNTTLWPPPGTGLVARPAFRREQTPVLSQCQCCGAELSYGSGTTLLQLELRVCSSCPPAESVRRAMLEGVEAGIRSASGDDDALPWPPYPFASDEYRGWRRGWWAGHFAADDNEGAVRARFALAVHMGWLRPTGGGAA